jgi:ribonuclease VapC
MRLTGTVVDSSALVSIVRGEPVAERLLESLASCVDRLVSVGTVLETSLVLQGKAGAVADVMLDDLLRDLALELVPVDLEQLRAARDAARRFGRGRHPAALNYGDCFSYALAVTRGLPLLFVGEDFTRTDVSALAY